MTLLNKTFKLSAYIFVLFSTASSLNAQVVTDSKSEELLNALFTVNGGYKKLSAKKDVQFDYVYNNFDKGKDISFEKHIFDGEHSWALYETHQVNVLPKQDGVAAQSLVDGKPGLTLNKKLITDEKGVWVSNFLRKVNLYWFSMIYKLKDPGTIYKHLGTEIIDSISYEKVKLTFNANITKKDKNDEYILYFNPKSHLVDFFYFSIVDFGINKPILKYELWTIFQ